MSVWSRSTLHFFVVSAVASIRLYKRFLSPLLPRACRFYPTCGSYAAAALERHGVVRGSALALSRLCRCHPFSSGGYDPCP